MFVLAKACGPPGNLQAGADPGIQSRVGTF
jgi:hypothetical protein